MPVERTAVTDDAALGGRLRLLQPRRGHRFGHDAILLAAAVEARPGQRVIELGAGIGAASLALLARVPGLSATLVEIDPNLTDLATHNIARNGFAAMARTVTLDVGATARSFAAAGLAPGTADHVLMNPPFNDPGRQASPERLRRMAHAAGAETLPDWIRAATRLLRPGGRLTLIWRSDGLAGILCALAKGYGAIAVRPVHAGADRPAIRVLVRGIKASRGPLSLMPALVLHAEPERASAAAEAVLREGRALPFSEAVIRSPAPRTKVAIREDEQKR